MKIENDQKVQISKEDDDISSKIKTASDLVENASIDNGKEASKDMDMKTADAKNQNSKKDHDKLKVAKE